MCGNCFGEPCVKVFACAQGDKFSVHDHIVKAGSIRYYIGDVRIDHHIPGVFLQITSFHNIDKFVIHHASLQEQGKLALEYLEWSRARAKRVGGTIVGADELESIIRSPTAYVRHRLNNPLIPTQTVKNRIDGLIRQGILKGGSTLTSAALTEKGMKLHASHCATK